VQGVKALMEDPSKHNTSSTNTVETFTAANKPQGAAKAQEDEELPPKRRSLRGWLGI
jgi:hypothetical protein